MFHCHVWKPDGIWNWQLKLEDPEGQAILSPVSTPKCSMHTGPTMFVFSVGLPFSRFPVFFWKPPNKSPAICDLSRTYRYVTYLLNILQVLQISCCFSRKKRKTIQPLRCSQCHSDPRHPYWSSWLAGSASGDLGVPQKSWPFGKPNRGFQQKKWFKHIEAAVQI